MVQQRITQYARSVAGVTCGCTASQNCAHALRLLTQAARAGAMNPALCRRYMETYRQHRAVVVNVHDRIIAGETLNEQY